MNNTKHEHKKKLRILLHFLINIDALYILNDFSLQKNYNYYLNKLKYLLKQF